MINLVPCLDASPNFLGIIDTTIAPPFLYYAYLPIIFISLFIGIFIFLKDRKALLSRLALLISITFSAWIINIIGQWINVYANNVHFFWQLTALFETAVFCLTLYFVSVYLNNEDVQQKTKVVSALIFLPILIALPTRFNIQYFDLAQCQGVVGYLWNYIYVLEALSVVLVAFMAFRKIKGQGLNGKKKSEVLLITSGAGLFLLIFFLSNVIGEATLNYQFNLVGPLGMVLFMGLISYSIVKYKTFNLKVFSAQALIIALIFILGSMFFIRTAENIHIVLIPSFLLTIIAGIFLTKAVKREVAQRERLEKLTHELESANGQLEQLNEQKSQFLSFASHDLKSPINIIKQFASLIADGTYKEPAKIQETIQKIKTNADRATSLVDDFLDIRKIEEGHMDYSFEVKDIVAFTRNAVEEYAPVAKAQKDLVLTFETKVPVTNVKIDQTRFRQVIQNLLSNSIKYTEKGWIKVLLTEEQKTVLIKVEDSGIGMEKELLPTLFEQFHRAPGVAKKIQGTGLGLYISKQIVIAHGGDVWVESEGKDKGSTFYVRIPKA